MPEPIARFEQGRFVDYDLARDIRDDLRADGLDARVDYDNRERRWVVSYLGIKVDTAND